MYLNRNPMHRLKLYLGLTYAIVSPTLGLASIGDLPLSWYTHPEDSSSTLSLSSTSEPTPDLTTLVGRIYETNQSTFERLPTYQPNQWHLGNFSTELTVTATGKFGVLGIRGIPNIMIFWGRRSQPSATSVLEQADESLNSSKNDEPSQIGISTDESREQLADDIEPVVQIAKSRGMKETRTLRKNLMNAALQFQDLTRGIENQPEHRWLVSGFRFDFNIGASGNLSPITVPATIGGEFRFRFEWVRKPAAHPPRLAASRTAESLARWLKSMRYALANLPEENMPGYHPSKMLFGIGITGGVTIGLAKGSASTIGYIMFEPNPNWRPSTMGLFSSGEGDLNDESEMVIIESDPEATHLAYADHHGIPHTETVVDSKVKQAAFRVKLGELKKGIHKAAKIARFFSKPTLRLVRKRWGIYQIKLQFDLSIAGDIGLVTLGVVPTIHMNFEANHL